MHDASPSHVLSAVREFLENVFPEQQLRQGGQTRWCACFSDLKHLDFSLWTSEIYCLCYRNH
jgi:hypothetical protein